MGQDKKGHDNPPPFKVIFVLGTGMKRIRLKKIKKQEESEEQRMVEEEKELKRSMVCVNFCEILYSFMSHNNIWNVTTSNVGANQILNS